MTGTLSRVSEAMEAAKMVQDSPLSLGEVGYNLGLERGRIIIERVAAEPVTAQCCVCGKKGLSTIEGDGGTETQLDDDRWTCSEACWDKALEWAVSARKPNPCEACYGVGGVGGVNDYGEPAMVPCEACGGSGRAPALPEIDPEEIREAEITMTRAELAKALLECDAPLVSLPVPYAEVRRRLRSAATVLAGREAMPTGTSRS